MDGAESYRRLVCEAFGGSKRTTSCQTIRHRPNVSSAGRALAVYWYMKPRPPVPGGRNLCLLTYGHGYQLQPELFPVLVSVPHALPATQYGEYMLEPSPLRGPLLNATLRFGQC